MAANRFYTIFSDSNFSTPSRRAQTVLGGIVDRWKRDRGDFTELQGYSDAQEAKTGRPSLPQERAEAAMSYLAAQGISAAPTTTDAFEAIRPLIPPNQAEPQNRRAEPSPRVFAPPWVREQQAGKLPCRTWFRDHCVTPSRLFHARAPACNAAPTAS